MEFDLRKPEQYAAWYLAWLERMSEPLFLDNGEIKFRLLPTTPTASLAQNAALDIVETHLLLSLKKLRHRPARPTTDSGSKKKTP